MADLKEVLIGARELLQRGWIQGALATNINGLKFECPWADPQATHFCMAGAILRACKNAGLDDDGPSFQLMTARAFSAVAREIGDDDEVAAIAIPKFNDHYSRFPQQIIAVMDSAIARLEVAELSAKARDFAELNAPLLDFPEPEECAELALRMGQVADTAFAAHPRM